MDGQPEDEWSVKQIKFLKKGETDHLVEWQIKISDSLSVPFEAYLFRPLGEQFVKHTRNLKMYVPKAAIATTGLM